jgi:methionyl-tRNA formyltransferase
VQSGKMKITLFTSNQPRHLALVAKIAEIASEVFVVLECRTNFPGILLDWAPKSPVMEKYFSYVLKAEENIFGPIQFLPPNVNVLALRSGDLNYVDISTFSSAFDSDHYIVFGSSYIKGELADFLVGSNAKNIHMGISPFYRGNSSNFWAIYDGRPDLVGATILTLGKGLDSGAILFHALPKIEITDPFTFGMEAVRIAIDSLIHYISNGDLVAMEPVAQNKKHEIRYTRAADFTDEVAQNYLEGLVSKNKFMGSMEKRDLSMFVRPYTEQG